MTIKILIAEDHELTRKGISYGLKSYNEIDVIGGFEDGKQTLDFIEKSPIQPDVVLLDIIMPVLNGIDTAKKIREMNPGIKIIMLTSVNEKETVLRAFNAGANAYAMKNISFEKLVSVIKMVLNGEVWIAPNIADYILDVLSIKAEDALPAKTAEDFKLTNREKEILSLIAKGMNNKDIANELIISLYTVKNNVKSIIQKLSVEDRTQAAILALTEKII